MNSSASSILRLVAGLMIYALPALCQTTEPSSTTLSSSQNPSVVGEPITLTAAVGPPAVSNDRNGITPKSVEGTGPRPLCAGICMGGGIVTFYDGATVLGTAAVGIPLGPATLVTSQLAPGVHSLSAYYAGDGYYAPSTSPQLAQTVLALQIVNAPSLPTGSVGIPYRITLTTNAGTGSYTWALSAGSTPPPGLSFSASGVLSGTPTVAGTTSFTVTVTDSVGTQVASATFSLTVTAVPQAETSFLVRTIAGGYGESANASLGDGGPALQGELSQPTSVAVDGLGNVFIADQGNNRIRKVAPTGVITTFAGTGVLGAAGDGGLATSAQLLGAQAVAVDNTGRVYIGECYGTGTSTPASDQLRVVSSTGMIATLAPGFSCVAALTVDAKDNVYAAGSYNGPAGIFLVSPNGAVTRIAGTGTSGYSGDGGPAISAQFSQPAGVAFDNQTGTLYVADEDNHRIRAISPTGIVQTVAGTGVPGFSGDGGLGVAAQLNYPSGVAVDAAGNVYISDSGNLRVRMLTPAGLISTVAGTGVADQEPSQFNPGNGDGGPAVIAPMAPSGTIAVDSNGNVYFPEWTGIISSVRSLVPSASTAGCMYSVLPAQVSFTTAGGANTANVIAAQNSCPWLAFSTADWVTVTSGANGIGNGTVDFNASANSLSANRTALIAIAGQRVTVSQPGLTCVFGIGVSQISAPAAGVSGTINVSANLPDCSWTAQTNSPWLFVITGASGQGNGVVSYSVAANGGAARTGTLTVAGQMVTFNQGAAGTSGTPLSISTDSTLPSGTLGTPYSQGLNATGGVPPYSWAVTSGALPSGISLVSLGGVLGETLNGVPTEQGTFPFWLKATDSSGATASNQFSLTINPASLTFSSSGVVNAASYVSGAVAPGEIVTIFGSGLGPPGIVPFQLDSNGHFPTALAGTQVLFDGVAAPLLFVQEGQVGAIVPYEVSGEASAQVQIMVQTQSSPSVTIPVAPAAPGIFAADASGKGPGAILNQDGTLNSASNPAETGSYIFIYATGEGQTTPPGVDGSLDGSPAPLPVLKVTGTIGGIDAPVQYAGGVSSLVAGVLQVNLQIPPGVSQGGPVPVILTIGGLATQAGLTVAIR